MPEHENFPLVSVIIIGKNERDTIERCILSIFNQSYPNFETIYIDDNSTDDTFEKANLLKNVLGSKKNCKRYLTASVKTDLPSKNRNIGIEASRGSIIAFIDGDCVAERDWLSNLFEQFSAGVGIVGGPTTLGHTKVSIKTKVIDTVLSSYLGSGGSSLFYQIKGDCEVDEVPSGNMAVQRHLLEKFGGFNERLRYNEDTYLCYKVRKGGYRIIYAAKARIFHFIGVDSYSDFISYFKTYGFERGKNTARSSSFLTPFNILSLALIACALFLLSLSFFISTAAIILLYLFIAVVLIEFAVSLRLVMANKSVTLLFLIMMYFISLHNIYNTAFIIGYMSGMKQLIIRKNDYTRVTSKKEKAQKVD